MDVLPDLVICEHCDHVYHRRALKANEAAHCQVCNALLYRGSRLTLDHWLALTLTAAIAFLMANVYPVIRIDFQGQQRETTLWQSTYALAASPAAPIAVPAMLSVVIVPLLQIVLLGWILGHARLLGQRAPGFAPAMRLLTALRPWSMVEVALLGLLVSIIKLSSLLSVIPGIGLWSTGALMLLMPVITHRDVWDLWQLPQQPAHRHRP